MKNIFPQGVRVDIGRTAGETKVIDIESGEIVSHVAGLVVEVDANDRTHMPRLILALCGIDIQVHTQEAEYEVPEDALRRIAEQNGFGLFRLSEAADVNTAVGISGGIIAGFQGDANITETHTSASNGHIEGTAIVTDAPNEELARELEPFNEKPAGYVDIDKLSDDDLAQVQNLDDDPEAPLGTMSGKVVSEHAPGTVVGTDRSLLKGGIGGLTEEGLASADELPRAIDTSDPS